MTRLTITRGLPASGKSTWARGMEKYGMVRVSRDDIRRDVFGLRGKGVLTPKRENEVTKIEVALVEAALNAGKSVVVDATHLRAKYATQWADLAEKHGALFYVRDFTTDEETCIARNANRDDNVPEEVIRGMAKRFPINSWPTIKPSGLYSEEPPITPYVPVTTKPTAYVFDVDGTLAQIGGGRNPYDASRAMEDTPTPHVLDIWDQLKEDHCMLVLTGRKATHRDVTERWLAHNVIHPYILWTRANGDNRPDWIVKQELFDTHIAPHFNVLGVFDDRMSVCRMWHLKGVPLFKVGDPEGVF